MLTITQVKSLEEKEKVNHFLEQYAKETLSSDKEYVFMVAKERGGLTGVGIFTILPAYATLENIVIEPIEEAEQLALSIGKAVLNFIDRKNIKKVYAQTCKNNMNFQNLLQQLRFTLADKEDEYIQTQDNIASYFLDLTDYFKKNGCQHR